jgi:parallel beta-helix repeat protein
VTKISTKVLRVFIDCFMKKEILKGLGIAAIFLMIASVILPINTWATDRYVKPFGINVGGCTNPGSPCGSIQYVIDVAQAGDTIIVFDGIYFENISFMGKAITVKSLHGPQSTVIDGNADGSVVYFWNGEGPDSVLDGITIRNGLGNDCWSGGGISLYTASPKIKNCKITGNTASPNGGGIICLFSSSPLIKKCEIKMNKGGSGAGIYVGSGSSPTITKCTITDNEIITVHGGGGIHCYESSAYITNCDIRGNMAPGGGGGIFTHSSSLELINCTITGNWTGWIGGGIASMHSITDIVNCTISGNRADNFGGAIYLSSEADDTLSVVNSILWDNLANVDGNVIWNRWINDVSIDYSDLPDWGGGTGNITQDPQFIQGLSPIIAPTSAGDYHLKITSPCIDSGTGDLTAYPGLPSNDIDGDPRPWYSEYDMGSDEYKLHLREAPYWIIPLEALNLSISYLESLQLHKGIKSSCISQLESAMYSLEKNHVRATKNKLNAFINHVEAQTGKKIPYRVAVRLIEDTWCVIDSLDRVDY